MARPKKVFTKTENWWARDYIDRKFRLDRDWPYEEWDQNYAARKNFEELPNGDPVAMHSWCNSYLDAKQQEQLLGALRARKKREKSEMPGKSITLTWKAWEYLSDLANRDKVTMSEFLVNRLEHEYMEHFVNEDQSDN